MLALMLVNSAFAFMGKPINLGVHSDQIANVRLEDVAQNTSIIEGLSDATAEITKNLPELLQERYEIEEVLNLFLRSVPTYSVMDSIKLPLTSVIRTKQGNILFVDLNVQVLKGEILSSSLVREIDLQNTNFSVNVSLRDRKSIISDSNYGIKMVVPLGVGSFDQSVLNNATTLLTPRFNNAFLDKRTAIHQRKKPRYFAKKPFIRITTSTNLTEGHTSIGFHAQPNLDTFVRAFDSHGCMRMQTNDLEMLYYIVSRNPAPRIPVNVKFVLNDSAEHPLGKINKPFKTVVNIASASEPQYTMDRDGLVLVKKIWDAYAPVMELVDRAGDNYHELFDYAMAWREKERTERIYKQCMEDKNLVDPSSKEINEENFTVNKADYYVDPAKYEVKWEDFKPVFSPFDVDTNRDREIKKAQRKYKRAVKKAQREYKRAKKAAERKYEADLSDVQNKLRDARQELASKIEAYKKAKSEAHKECHEKSIRKLSFRDRLYRRWVHGKDNKKKPKEDE
jgi:hypothetical protein